MIPCPLTQRHNARHRAGFSCLALPALCPSYGASEPLAALSSPFCADSSSPWAVIFMNSPLTARIASAAFVSLRRFCARGPYAGRTPTRPCKSSCKASPGRPVQSAETPSAPPSRSSNRFFVFPSCSPPSFLFFLPSTCGKSFRFRLAFALVPFRKVFAQSWNRLLFSLQT